MDKKINEATARMETLGMDRKTIDAFLSEGILPVFVSGMPAEAGEETKKHIRQVEEDYGILVYTAVCGETPYGFLETLLYVGPEDDWECEREGLAEGETFAYVCNVSRPECSEFGLVGLETGDGIPERIR